MTTVRFNAVDEFVAELLADRELVERGIVRVTKSFRSGPSTPFIQSITVIATAVVGETVVRLDRYCGDYWRDMARTDDDALSRAADAVRELEERLSVFDVRAGVVDGGDEKP